MFTISKNVLGRVFGTRHVLAILCGRLAMQFIFFYKYNNRTQVSFPFRNKFTFYTSRHQQYLCLYLTWPTEKST